MGPSARRRCHAVRHRLAHVIHSNFVQNCLTAILLLDVILTLALLELEVCPVVFIFIKSYL